MTISILYIITRLDRGGSAEAVLQWAEAFKKRGYHTAIVTGKTIHPQCDLSAYSWRTGVEIITVDSLLRELNPWQDLKSLWKLCQIIRKIKPQIVHTNTSKAGIIGRFAAWLCKTSVIIHTTHGHIFYGYYGKLKTAIFIGLEKLAALVTDTITELTHLGVEDHIKLKIAPRKKFAVVYAGIDLDKYSHPLKSKDEIKKELNLPPDKIIIGWVGRFDSIKNPLLLIQAADLLKDHPDLHFLMAGDGELFAQAKQLTREMHIEDNFTFPGFRNDIPDLLSVMDIYCLTSLNEGLGRSILEAQAAGCAVIASNVGGVPEIVEHQITGILFPSGDYNMLAENIADLSRHPPLRKKLIEAAKNRLFAFSLQKTIDDIDNLYQKWLSLKFD